MQHVYQNLPPYTTANPHATSQRQSIHPLQTDKFNFLSNCSQLMNQKYLIYHRYTPQAATLALMPSKVARTQVALPVIEILQKSF